MKEKSSDNEQIPSDIEENPCGIEDRVSLIKQNSAFSFLFLFFNMERIIEYLLLSIGI